MTPEELFYLHTAKVRLLVDKTVWHYKCSGALHYQEEAYSEAQMALWRFCHTFDPTKQLLQSKKERARQTLLFYSLIFEIEEPEYEPSDPYANFWMLAVLYVRGAVIDFFRAERLIHKRPLRPEMKKFNKLEILRIKERLSNRESPESPESIAEELGVNIKSILDLKPTLFKHERFVSLDRNLSDFAQSGSGGATTFLDVLPAPDHTKQDDEQSHLSYMLQLAREDADLNKKERKVVDLFFSDRELTKIEVAKKMKLPQSQVTEILNSALQKIRQYWPEIVVDNNGHHASH